MAVSKTLGRYQIVKELGRGAMGVVYKGIDPKISRTVALKTIKLDNIADPSQIKELKERFFREARAAGKMSHPGIVTVYDLGEEGELSYIAMEFVEGRELTDLMKSVKQDDLSEILRITTEVSDALDYAHEQGIVHRDIKPSNILVTRSGKIKIADFGLARLQSGDSITKTGHAVGTPGYMAPEQIKGLNVDARADLHSLGVILYEMLTGEKPFAADSISSILYKIVNELPDPPSKHNPLLSSTVDEVVLKSISKEPAERFQTGSEMVEALKRALSHMEYDTMATQSASTAKTGNSDATPAADVTSRQTVQPPPASKPPLPKQEPSFSFAEPLPVSKEKDKRQSTMTVRSLTNMIVIAPLNIFYRTAARVFSFIVSKIITLLVLLIVLYLLYFFQKDFIDKHILEPAFFHGEKVVKRIEPYWNVASENFRKYVMEPLGMDGSE